MWRRFILLPARVVFSTGCSTRWVRVDSQTSCLYIVIDLVLRRHTLSLSLSLSLSLNCIIHVWVRTLTGTFTTGQSGSRSGVRNCSLGQYCVNGTATECPLGFYGDEIGLFSPNCSGSCADGVLCEPGTTEPEGQLCPAGSYCLHGVPFLCPAGTYNADLGATNMYVPTTSAESY